MLAGSSEDEDGGIWVEKYTSKQHRRDIDQHAVRTLSDGSVLEAAAASSEAGTQSSSCMQMQHASASEVSQQNYSVQPPDSPAAQQDSAMQQEHLSRSPSSYNLHSGAMEHRCAHIRVLVRDNEIALSTNCATLSVPEQVQSAVKAPLQQTVAGAAEKVPDQSSPAPQHASSTQQSPEVLLKSQPAPGAQQCLQINQRLWWVSTTMLMQCKRLRVSYCCSFALSFLFHNTKTCVACRKNLREIIQEPEG